VFRRLIVSSPISENKKNSRHSGPFFSPVDELHDEAESGLAIQTPTSGRHSPGFIDPRGKVGKMLTPNDKPLQRRCRPF
jgi:hypothetical protein